MDLALLSASLRRARDWGDCALNLAFPWPLSAEAEPSPIKPPFCRQCGYPYPALAGFEADFICEHCAERKWHFLWARAGFMTAGQVREAILGFKYEEEYFRNRQLTDWLTGIYDQHAAPEGWDALVPVPLYRRRHRERGFNQARELARGLAKARKLKVLDCLYRYRETLSQAKLGREERWENMVDAFQMKPGFDVKGLNLLIIDDVFTTGATVNACAQVLAKAGAARLAVLTVSRS